MTYKNFKTIRVLIIILVGAIVAAAVTINNFYLALLGILIGLLFNFLVRIKFKKTLVDERIETISGRAARTTYTIITMFLALMGLLLIVYARQQQDFYTEALGVTFAYLAMFNITIYALSFKFFNKKYGGDE